MKIGNAPKYVSSQPSTFMKDLQIELAEKRIKDAKDAKERSDNTIEETEEGVDYDDGLSKETDSK